MFSRIATINLDISDFCLKAARLVGSKHDVSLERVRRLALPEGAIQKGRIIDLNAVSGLIRRIITDVGGGRRNGKVVNAVLPDTATFIKLIDVESSSNQHQFIKNVEDEIVHHIPYGISDVSLDWQTVGRQNIGSERVLVGVCPKEVVDEYTSVIERASLAPKNLEVESLPIVRSIFQIKKGRQKDLSNRNVIVLDIGAARSSIIFYQERPYNQGDTIEFSVSLPFSGHDIDVAIEKTLSIPHDQALKFKVTCGLLSDEPCNGVLLKIIEPLLQDLINRLRQAIDFHTTHFAGTVLNGVILTGGGANLKGLKEYIEYQVKIPVSLGDPRVNLKNKDILTQAEALSYCSVIGLGLADFYQ
ncbi:MAG: type IV pilus assembly protein PilM [Candidatus Jacksonbacteria bacterium]|nr:type IV pilus assembly protein PilM [Candidatus Jacksonbacteria bacterium]